jgi:hypothetical protein
MNPYYEYRWWQMWLGMWWHVGLAVMEGQFGPWARGSRR